ncbi:16S rRNA (uracil(1498)-N(3))-methyltransferase [Acidovorax sp. SUPP2522]|uniref:16S rRNA (uracil(1498)-N(3))-methyltransferase n=1 Tax=unclassified Acidovorax TaxID=2684926 RepID=UPI002349D1C5|nr:MULTISPECIES: 16S rRNA (uracil(1498)-N(3))-methyltransferase [unclassified Acidovorax]WCM97887.1 16S rRNA (uracil(1498)-N(3))-methyltransferase [Acidovorax sp. GBBC 1281]GKT16351.1 16S rRNA (uracil(1498)-N(3))-methyltransferase [Acidovorax sp. SUPP2522]
MPRFHCPLPLAGGAALALPPSAARHVQVLRLQPGDAITLFDGRGGEYAATITRMGRSDVDVEVGAHDPVEREAARAVHLVVGMPANERMDWLVEKAAELGAASIQPVAAARSVLKLSGERAQKRQAHWQAIAVAACEQCGRNRVPEVYAPVALADWLRAQAAEARALEGGLARLVLSLRDGSRPLREAAGAAGRVQVLHGPEGGLTAQEEDLALAHGFAPASLGARVLRAETASVAALAQLAFE